MATTTLEPDFMRPISSIVRSKDWLITCLALLLRLARQKSSKYLNLELPLFELQVVWRRYNNVEIISVN